MWLSASVHLAIHFIHLIFYPFLLLVHSVIYSFGHSVHLDICLFRFLSTWRNSYKVSKSQPPSKQNRSSLFLSESTTIRTHEMCVVCACLSIDDGRVRWTRKSRAIIHARRNLFVEREHGRRPSAIRSDPAPKARGRSRWMIRAAQRAGLRIFSQTRFCLADIFPDFFFLCGILCWLNDVGTVFAKKEGNTRP